MKTELQKSSPFARLPALAARGHPGRRWLCYSGTALLFVLATLLARAHVVPPEQFHPAVESYRRLTFLLNLNPVLWDEVKSDADRVATSLESISKQRADVYRAAINKAVAKPTAPPKEGEEPAGPEVRREAARAVSSLDRRV